ncbi:ATP-dependent rRNA helicase spb4 [Glugoides intestinalis]
MILNFFNDLDVDKKLLTALDQFGFSQLTPVQQSVIPQFLKKDVVVMSQTGSGKTLSYLIPVINNLYKQRQLFYGNDSENTTPLNGIFINALIISPTRELCIQIQEIVQKFSVLSEVFIGGLPIEDDLKKLDVSIEIAIGTPGRLCEIIQQNIKKFGKIKYLVLDESDKLLSLGFEAKLLKILELIPKNRTMGLFSATSSDAVMKIAQISLKSPAMIKINETTPELLQLKYITASPVRKLELLFKLVYCKKAIVFLSTCNYVDFFYEIFKKVYENDKNTAFHKIHGKMNQNDRSAVYTAFESGNGILFCTDVAARGIDFKNIELVIHFDVPKDYTNVVHRSGRTARMGAEGLSIIFLMPNEKTFVNLLKLKGVSPDEIIDEKDDSVETSQVSTHFKVKERMDKNLLDLSVKAFVSYIRAYKEHILNHILNYKELDFDGIAELHCLERIPSMTELKSVRFKNYERPVGNTTDKRKFNDGKKGNRKVKKVKKENRKD